MKVKISMKQVLAVAVLLNLLVMLQSIPVTANPVSPTVYFDDVPSQATYTIKTDGTNYWAVRYDGYVEFESTNASYTIDNLIQANTTIKFMSGTFPINYLLKVDVSKIHFIGNGWGTQFTIGASGGFNISSATLLRDIVFEDIWWEGAGTAIRAITSAMPTNIRITEFRFSHNRVNDIDAAGAIGLNMSNLENSEISYNTFYTTRIAHIQMTSNGYDAGNVRIIGNEFYWAYNQASESAVKIIPKKVTAGNGGMDGYYMEGNHYLAGSYKGYAWNITTIEGNATGFHFVNERSEGGGFIYVSSAGASSTAKIVEIINSKIINSAIANVILINFGTYTVQSSVIGCYLSNSGTTPYLFMDNGTSTTNGNIFMGNVLATSTGFSPAPTTIISNNVGISSYYTVKTEGSNNIRYSISVITNYGATASGIASKTIYTVHSSDMYLNVSGGTVSNIKIYDPSGTEIADFGSNAEFVRIPRMFQFNITWTVEPTMKFLWTQ